MEISLIYVTKIRIKEKGLKKDLIKQILEEVVDSELRKLLKP